MQGYKLAQKRFSSKTPNHYSQLKLPSVDKRISERDGVKGLLKIKSGKIPILNVEIYELSQYMNTKQNLNYRDVQVE